MHSGMTILGITVALAAAAVGCSTETTGGAGGGSTASATGSASSTAGAGGGSTTATTGGSGATTAAGSTGTGSASCPFESSACETCLAQSCANTQCAKDTVACKPAFDMMRKGCACTAQKSMDKTAESTCIGQFAMDSETAAQVNCVTSSCQALCYLPQ
jgi:hypothetical protein